MKYPPRTFKNIVAIVKILELHTENGTRRSKMTLLKNRGDTDITKVWVHVSLKTKI